ncbi:hypothetical protein [Oenococcus sicerae]
MLHVSRQALSNWEKRQKLSRYGHTGSIKSDIQSVFRFIN